MCIRDSSGITDELTPVTVTDEFGNLVETLSEAWPPSDEVAFGSVAFDLPDALVGVSQTYKGVHPDNDNHTLYFDETGAYLGSAEFYTSEFDGLTNGYGVEFFDADDNAIGEIRYNIPDDGPVTRETSDYTEVVYLESSAPVYWDASAYYLSLIHI